MGVYIPAQLVSRQLRSLGIDVQLYIIERLLTEEKQDTFRASQKAFARNVRLAQLGTRLPASYASGYSPEAVSTLFDTWDHHPEAVYLCFSGLWFSLLAMYQQKAGKKIVTCCHMDAAPSVAWQHPPMNTIDQVYALYEHDHINYALTVSSLKKQPYDARARRAVVHGGGWGIGHYTASSQALEASGYERHIITPATTPPPDGASVYYTTPSSWDPLAHDVAALTFPPLETWHNQAWRPYATARPYHAALQLAMESRVIVSKPGGMTLTDAILTETPLLYLDALGIHEEGNRQLIDTLGIGMPFDSWEKSGFDDTVLQRLHQNIVSIKSTLPDFVTCYLTAINH